jgi:mannose-6-phosphate isomerase
MESEQRPWGAWHVLDEGPGYKVKRIDVLPGARLSYQLHRHRSEHWTVVRGTATCVVDDETVVLRAGESLDVSLGAPHRIANTEDGDLVIIEVQRGDYLGEDDIERLEDDYGREASATT